MNPSSFDGLNNFITQLENINESLISQCKVGDKLNLCKESKPDDINFVGVVNKSGEYLGYINSAVVRNYNLAFDIDHGADISAKIKQIISMSGKLECIIEISKGDVDWKEYDDCFQKDEEAKHIIFKAKTLEKVDTEKAILLYRNAIEILKEIDRKFENYSAPWRHTKFPINRLSLVLERQKRYKECLKEIEAYENITDKLGLYVGEKEKLQKRREKITKLIKSC